MKRLWAIILIMVGCHEEPNTMFLESRINLVENKLDRVEDLEAELVNLRIEYDNHIKDCHPKYGESTAHHLEPR